MEIKKHTPLRLMDAGYKKICKMVDERDGGCIVCKHPHVQHHHVIFRSAGGEDTLENLVCLCPTHHDILAHGTYSKYWRRQFLAYLAQEKAVRFSEEHFTEAKRIYRMERRVKHA